VARPVIDGGAYHRKFSVCPRCGVDNVDDPKYVEFPVARTSVWVSANIYGKCGHTIVFVGEMDALEIMNDLGPEVQRKLEADKSVGAYEYWARDRT
jgi:hypothetical protein